MGLDFSLHYFEDDVPAKDKGIKYWRSWCKPYFGMLGKYFLKDMAYEIVDDYWLKVDWWKVKEELERAFLSEVRVEWEENKRKYVHMRSFQVEEIFSLLEAIEDMHDRYDIEKVWIAWSV